MREIVLRHLSLFASFILAAGILGCGGDDGGPSEADQVIAELADSIGQIQPVQLDTASIAGDVRAGRTVGLPFVKVDNQLVEQNVSLTLRNLRDASLTVADVKDGVTDSFETLLLPPPATYQGFVEPGRGPAVFTINDRVVEGNMLIAPEGWSLIEPLEPLLRQRNFTEGQRQAALAKYNHVVYNALNAIRTGSEPVDDNPGGGNSGSPQESALVFPVVADGDAALYAAYPRASVMPFWLKQEALFNVVDWLFNCVEPGSNPGNAYTRCDNGFDGGHDGFQASISIERLEVWKAGGPSSPSREALLHDSILATHQASPPCCGPPHTAGRAPLVNFFSGKTLAGGSGEAAGVGGLDVYDEETCQATGTSQLCHHSITQVVVGGEFPGTTFYQQLLLAHEIGHVAGAAEQPNFLSVCWLFEQQCGPNLMGSYAFGGNSKYLFTDSDAMFVIGPLLSERLPEAP